MRVGQPLIDGTALDGSAVRASLAPRGTGSVTRMAIPKTLGIETEYGIVLRGTENSNPIAASSLLINAYLFDLAGRIPKVEWDFEDESPGNDARGAAPLDAMPPSIETHLVNAVLTNGAR